MRPRAEEIPINDVSVIRWVKLLLLLLSSCVHVCDREKREQKAIYVVSCKCENELKQVY